MRTFLLITPRRGGFRLDVRLVSLCQAFFPPFLRQGLRLDVRLVSVCYNMPHTVRLQRLYRATTLTGVVGL